MADRQERLLMRQRGAGTRQVKDLEFQILLPGIAAAESIVKPSPLKPQKSKRSRKTPQPDLVPRRTPRRTTPSAQPIIKRSSRRNNGTAPNKKIGKPSSLDPTNGGIQDGAMITLSTNLEGPGTKEGEFVPTVAHEAKHVVGLPLVPGGKDGRAKPNEDTKSPKTVKPQGNKRKKTESIGQYSKKKPTLATSRETPGYATLPDIEGLNLVNTGPNEAAVEEASQAIVAPHTPEKQTGCPDLTDIISSTNAAQSPGEIRRRLIAIAQSSLKRLRLELPDEAQETQETEETLIQPSIEAPAPITHGPELTVAGGAGDSNESRILDPPQSNLPDPAGTISPIVAAPLEREKKDPEIVARPYMEGQKSAVLQQAPAAEPQGGEIKEEPKSKSPAQGFGDAMSHHDEPLGHHDEPLGHHDEPLELPPHEDLACQDSLQEDPPHNDPPHEKPPPEDPPDEDPPREASVENDDGNLGAALSITKPITKPKRKKRKAIGQQSLRKKAKPAVKPTIRRPAPNPASKYQVTHINQTSKVNLPEKAGSSQITQVLDDEEEDLLHTSNYEPATGLARGLGRKPRAADLEDSIVGRNVGEPGAVDKLATRKGRMSIKGSDNEPRNETGFGRAKKATIKTSQKLQLHHSPSKRSKTSTIAKRNLMIKKPRGRSSLRNEPSSLDDDNFWHPQRSGSDEPIKPLSRRRGPRLRPPLEEENELRAIDRRASTKTDSFDKGEYDTEEELGGIDPIALAREDFASQDKHYDEHSNEEDAGRISTKAINKSYQRPQSEVANQSKTKRPRPRAATRKPPKNSIPITVYRMPSTHDLDPDTDDSNQTNDTINAVDVLAQVCREQISKSATSASEAADQKSNHSEKLALERKAKAIKLYGDELDIQLFHLTQTLNTNTSLTSSSHQTKNRESRLRAELSSLQGTKSALVEQATDIELSRNKSHRRRRIYALLGEIRDAVKQGRELDGYDDYDNMGGSAAAGVVKVSALWNLEGGQIDDEE